MPFNAIAPDSTVGFKNSPDLFSSAAATTLPLIKDWFTYPIAPSRFSITPATPEFPLPPTPTGHWTDLPVPRVHSGENACMELVKAFVVPEPSERCTQVMVPASQPRSFQSVILPMATWTACCCVSFKSQPGLLYPNAMVPPTIGIWTTPRSTWSRSEALIGSSDAAKSTVWSKKARRPEPEPTAW